MTGGFVRFSPDYVRLTPESRHSEAPERLELKKRTLNVCFTPNSGRSMGYRRMSAFDPKRTLGALDVTLNKQQFRRFLACLEAKPQSAHIRVCKRRLMQATQLCGGAVFEPPDLHKPIAGVRLILAGA